MIYIFYFAGDRGNIICTVILSGDMSTQFNPFVAVGDKSDAFPADLECS